jgi:hypothetical protein
MKEDGTILAMRRNPIEDATEKVITMQQFSELFYIALFGSHNLKGITLKDIISYWDSLPTFSD